MAVEQPEVRIMSEFLHQELGQRSVTKIEKNPLSKRDCDFSCLEGKEWNITSEYRGKELIIRFKNDEEDHPLKISLGRVGSIEKMLLSEIDEDYLAKHAQLKFYTEDAIYFVSDFTRFSLWRWAEFDPLKSPDIVLEHNAWRKKIYENRKKKGFKNYIFELMPNQNLFNGLGNFSRSEILARVRFSPFTRFNEVLEDEVLRTDFFEVCREVLEDSYRLGGLQFDHWKNPFGQDSEKFDKWVRAYNHNLTCYYLRDSKGRVFWFERKWNNDYIDWAEDNEISDTRLLKKIYRKRKFKH